MTTHPTDLKPYLSDARAMAKAIRHSASVETIFLDTMNSGTSHGPRLVYEPLCGKDVHGCALCSLYKVVGEDPVGSDSLRPILRRSLCRAETDTTHYGTSYPYLNCMSPEEYKAGLVQWIIKRCASLTEFQAGLQRILNFRVLIYRGDDNPLVVTRIEVDFKREILNRVIAQIANDETKRALAREALTSI